MQKTLYSFTLLATLGLIGYTGYYTFTHYKNAAATPQAVILTATTTTPLPETGTSTTYRTSDGKEITVTETNPLAETMSTISIHSTGFATNTQITLEKNKLQKIWLEDITNDAHEELILTTIASNGGYGEVILFTTASATQLLEIKTPQVTEEDTKPGKLFENYAGHDTFILANKTLTRSFAIKIPQQGTTTPLMSEKQVLYQVLEQGGIYTATFLPITSSSSSLVQATTTKGSLSSQVSTSTKKK